MSDSWRDMASAPKDGSSFWGLVDGSALKVFWHPGFGEFISSFRRMTMAPGLLIDGEPFKDHSQVAERPTHWMPAIEPPVKP